MRHARPDGGGRPAAPPHQAGERRAGEAIPRVVLPARAFRLPLRRAAEKGAGDEGTQSRLRRLSGVHIPLRGFGRRRP